MGLSMFEKIWRAHVVGQLPGAEGKAKGGPAEGGNTLLYIDRHILHDLKALILLRMREAGQTLRHPARNFAVIDHAIPTQSQQGPYADGMTGQMVAVMREEAQRLGYHLFDIGAEGNGITHVVGPEQGIALPGITLCCGDSHTATQGAVGALAFGIGSTECVHVMVTQVLQQQKPRSMRVNFTGTPGPGIYAKDLILALIGQIGIGGGTGHVIEYAGPAIRALSMEGRMTLCNMTIEGGARAGMVAPDDITFQYVQGRPFAPHGPDWDAALDTAQRCLAEDNSWDATAQEQLKAYRRVKRRLGKK